NAIACREQSLAVRGHHVTPSPARRLRLKRRLSVRVPSTHLETTKMNTPQIRCATEDGDACLSPVKLRFWDISFSAGRTFDAEVIFNHWPPNYETKKNEFIDFFVPRHHPRVAAIEAYLAEALGRVLREEYAAPKPELDGWRPGVSVSVYRYSGVAGALISNPILREGELRCPACQERLPGTSSSK